MLISILQGAYPLLHDDIMFVDGVKQYMFVALSLNGVSPLAVIFQLAIDAFIIILTTQRTHYKIQLQIFLKDILCNILELPSRSDMR